MITLAHPTTHNNVREVALALLEAGLLETFHTCIAPCGGNFFDRISALPGLGEIRRRQCHPGLRPKLRLHPWLEAIRLATRDSGPSLHVYRVYKSLDRAVARHVGGQAGIRGVYCYEDGALETFRRAKRTGAACLYDLPIAYWQTVRRLSEEERDRLPEWAPTLRSLSDSAEKLRRKDEELALADAILCPSRFVEESLPEAVRREKRIYVAPFGSPCVAVPPSDDSHFRSPKLKVLFVGVMTQRKGLADLFAAMRLLDPARYELHILGSLMAAPAFYRSQGTFIHHAGRPSGQVLELMSRCHVLVLPSLAEGRSLVLQEAMACGLPVVVTRNTGAEDLVADGKAGFLVPMRDSQAIAQRLEQLGRDRDLLAAMSAAARSKAASLPWDGYRSLVVDAVRSAVAEAAGHGSAPGPQSDQS